MSATYHPVGWNRSKYIYDAVLLAGIALYILAFIRLAPMLRPAATMIDQQSLRVQK